MKRFLMISTGVLTLALLLGEVFYPNFPLIWMASEATAFVFIRAAIVVVLAVALFSDAVGISLFKPLLLAGAGALAVLVTVLLVSDSLMPADGVIFIETAIVLTLEALETPLTIESGFENRPVGKLGVGNDFVKIS